MSSFQHQVRVTASSQGLPFLQHMLQVLALMLERNPHLTPLTGRQALAETAIDLGPRTAHVRTVAAATHFLRQAQARTVEATWRQIGTLIDRFSPAEFANYFRNAGYASV